MREGVAKIREHENDTAVIVVHGTWAREENWWQPGGEFCKNLDKELQKGDKTRGAQCWKYQGRALEPFSWSGSNLESSRREAAVEFAAYLQRLTKQERVKKIQIIAHSHGGNVVFRSLFLLKTEPYTFASIDNIVFLGTPWYEFSEYGFSSRLYEYLCKGNSPESGNISGLRRFLTGMVNSLLITAGWIILLSLLVGLLISVAVPLDYHLPILLLGLPTSLLMSISIWKYIKFGSYKDIDGQSRSIEFILANAVNCISSKHDEAYIALQRSFDLIRSGGLSVNFARHRLSGLVERSQPLFWGMLFLWWGKVGSYDRDNIMLHRRFPMEHGGLIEEVHDADYDESLRAFMKTPRLLPWLDLEWAAIKAYSANEMIALRKVVQHFVAFRKDGRKVDSEFLDELEPSSEGNEPLNSVRNTFENLALSLSDALFMVFFPIYSIPFVLWQSLVFLFFLTVWPCYLLLAASIFIGDKILLGSAIWFFELFRSVIVRIASIQLAKSALGLDVGFRSFKRLERVPFGVDDTEPLRAQDIENKKSWDLMASLKLHELDDSIETRMAEKSNSGFSRSLSKIRSLASPNERLGASDSVANAFSDVSLVHSQYYQDPEIIRLIAGILSRGGRNYRNFRGMEYYSKKFISDSIRYN